MISKEAKEEKIWTLWKHDESLLACFLSWRELRLLCYMLILFAVQLFAVPYSSFRVDEMALDFMVSYHKREL